MEKVTKKCSKCFITKLVDEFYFRSDRGNYYSMCKECISNRGKKRRKADLINFRKKDKEKRLRNKEYYKKYRVIWRKNKLATTKESEE